MTSMIELPEGVIELWNKWEIRAMVLLSLFLQIILIIFGSRRKHDVRIWVRILVWSAYLSADMVATVALGNIARSQGCLGDNSSLQPQKPRDALLVFWAPFLLLHLGGPDTITSYALEDNELWLRHLLNLVIQVGVTLYIFIKSRSRTTLTFLAIPIFVAGVIKYGERTWVLRSSGNEHKRNSLRSTSQLSPSSTIMGENYFQEASSLFVMSKRLFFDLMVDISKLEHIDPFMSEKSSEDAFQLVEVELGFLYDELHTKVPIAFSLPGIVLRSTCFLSYITSLVAFEIKVDKQCYSGADLGITYLLLGGACLLEVYAFFLLVLSDWMMVLLTRRGSTATKLINGKNLVDGTRWSGSMAQCNLINSFAKVDPPVCLKMIGIDELMKYPIGRVNVHANLKKVIYEQLQKKREDINRVFGSMEGQSDAFFGVRDEQLAMKGEAALERNNCSDDFLLRTTEIEFNRSLLIWHIATDLCYYDFDDEVGENQSGTSSSSVERETCKYLSDYMLYLLVMKPDMLPRGIDVGYMYETTRAEVKIAFRNKQIQSIGGREIWQEFMSFSQNFKFDRDTRWVLGSGCEVARRLWGLNEDKWVLIREVWIEKLAFAASHCPWKEHAQQLRRGGELLTHVCLLMAHLGLSRQYQIRGVLV